MRKKNKARIHLHQQNSNHFAKKELTHFTKAIMYLYLYYKINFYFRKN
jgi:hypothetical protein